MVTLLLRVDAHWMGLFLVVLNPMFGGPFVTRIL